MCASPSSHRTTAEINFGDGRSAEFSIGNRSLHQFWHLFSSPVRNVLLAPQRRPDTGKVAWIWREAAEASPLTAQEMADVRRRLTEANRLLSASSQGKIRIDDAAGELDAQVREKASAMVAQLIAKGDQALAGFVCRTETGPMIHSWGAATPAQPHHSSTSEGAISGSVFVGPDRTEGLTVVLENRSGGFVARTKSGTAGAFSFPNLAPGSYRVRVTGRGDFPASGLAVAMERESITGLELRSKATAEGGAITSAANESNAPAAAQSAPGRQRRIIAWLAAFTVLASGGFTYWRSTQRTAGGAKPDPSKPAGWQSASGHLADSTDHSAPADVQRVGSDGQFSDLTAASHFPNPPAPSPASGIKPLAPSTAAQKNPNSKKDAGAEAPPPESSSSADAATLQEKPSRSVSSAEKSPDPAATRGNRNATDAEKRPAASRENSVAPKDLASAEEANNSAASIAGKSAVATSPKAQAKPPRPAIAAGPATAAEPVGDPSSSDETTAPAAPSTASSADPANQSAGSPTEKNQPGPNANQAAPTAGPAAPGSPDSTESPSSGAAAGSRPGQVAGKTPAGAKAAAARSAVAAPAETTPTPAIPPPASADPAAVSEPPEGNNPAQLPDPAQRPPGSAGRTSPALAPPAAPPPDSPAANAPPAPPAAAQAPVPIPAGKHPKAGAPTSIPSDDHPAAPPETASPATDASSSIGEKSSQKNPASATKAPAASAGEAPASPPPDSAALRSPGFETGTALVRVAMIPLARVRATAWKPRQLHDLILATRPVPIADEEASAPLREKLRQEQIARIPPSFRPPVSASGFAVEFPADKSGLNAPPEWHAATGLAPVGVTVQGNRAEVAWPGTAPSHAIEYVLRYPDGREIARVHTDEAGAPSLEIAATGRAWYWVGLVRSPADETATTSPLKARRLDWQLLSGASLPESWRQSDHWLGSQGHRLDLPLNGNAADERPYSLALVDQLTGWAVVSEIRLR